MGLIEKVKEYIGRSESGGGSHGEAEPVEDEDDREDLIDAYGADRLRRQKYPTHTGKSAIEKGLETYEDEVGDEPDTDAIDAHMAHMRDRLEEQGVPLGSYAERLHGRVRDEAPMVAAYIAGEYLDGEGARDREREDALRAYDEHWRDREKQLAIAERHDLSEEKKREAAKSIVWGEDRPLEERRDVAERHLDDRDVEYVYGEMGKEIVSRGRTMDPEEREELFNQYTFRELRAIIGGLHGEEREELLEQLHETTERVLGRYGLEVPDEVDIRTKRGFGASYDPEENAVKIGTGLRRERELEEVRDADVYTDTMPSLAVVGHEYVHARQGLAQHKLRSFIEEKEGTVLAETDFVRDIHRTITGNEAYQKGPLMHHAPERVEHIVDLADKRHEAEGGEDAGRYVELLDHALRREMDLHDIDARIRDAEREATAHLFSLMYADRIRDEEMREQYVEHTGGYMDTQSEDAARVFLDRWDEIREQGRDREEAMRQVFNEMTAIHDLATHDIDDYLEEDVNREE